MAKHAYSKPNERFSKSQLYRETFHHPELRAKKCERRVWHKKKSYELFMCRTVLSTFFCQKSKQEMKHQLSPNENNEISTVTHVQRTNIMGEQGKTHKISKIKDQMQGVLKIIQDDKVMT